MKQKSYLFLMRLVLVIFTAVLISQKPVYAGDQPSTIQSAAALETVYLPLVTKNYTGIEGFGTVTGTVRDARTGLAIEGIQVCTEGGICSSLTGIGGLYTLQGVPSGVRKLTALDPANTYSPGDEFVMVQANSSVSLDFKLFPVLLSNEFRVILTWDSNASWPCFPNVCPNDYNLHMWWRESDTATDYTRIDIEPENQGDCENLDIEPNACYENDEQFGSGPDTIVFQYGNPSSPGIYYIAVLNYYAGQPNVPDFFDRTPPARVQIYNGLQENPIYDYSIDPDITDGSGDLWYVIQLNFGNPVFQNCLTQFDQIGDVPPQDCSE